MFCSHCGERLHPIKQQQVILRLSAAGDPTEDIIDKFKATEGRCPCGHVTYGQTTN